jgi:hypothetical protein
MKTKKKPTNVRAAKKRGDKLQERIKKLVGGLEHRINRDTKKREKKLEERVKELEKRIETIEAVQEHLLMHTHC